MHVFHLSVLEFYPYNKPANGSSIVAYLARQVGFCVGIPKEASLFTVNRLCGSVFQSVVNGYQEICIKDDEIVLHGGAKHMSQTPFCVINMDIRTKFGLKLKLEDSL